MLNVLSVWQMIGKNRERPRVGAFCTSHSISHFSGPGRAGAGAPILCSGEGSLEAEIWVLSVSVMSLPLDVTCLVC